MTVSRIEVQVSEGMWSDWVRRRYLKPERRREHSYRTESPEEYQAPLLSHKEH